MIAFNHRGGMHTPSRIALLLGLTLIGAACAGSGRGSGGNSITAVTADGVTIHGEPYFGELDRGAPLVLLFHQGGSNGRGEYGQIARWLNREGFRAVAWDLRAGGETYGSTNRTVDGLAPDTPAGFCDAYQDLETALDHALTTMGERRVLVWGSSFSGSLVFQLAARHPAGVAGVIAFSPASGGPMTECRARMWAPALDIPVLVLRPESEMQRESSVEQARILREAGATFEVVKDGIHGSSMLLDERTGADMSRARDLVADWLRRVSRDAG